MANAGKDQNGISTIIGLSTADGVTILPVYINPSNHGLKINDASTGSRSGNHALKDGNFVPTMTALSSAGDGSIVSLYTDSSTRGLLIDSH